MPYTYKKDIKPQTKKSQAILALMPPTNVKELRRFLGIVQYHQDMRIKSSKILAPVTDLVGGCGQTKVTKALGTQKVAWLWDMVHQEAFNLIEATMVKDMVLAQDYNETFEDYTDASAAQLGAVITQNNRPARCLICKNNTVLLKLNY